VSVTSRITARISRARRNRFSGVAVIVLGLLLAGGMFAMFSPAQGAKKADDADAIAKGRALFLVGCASCHGINGEGIQTQRDNQYGPPLVGVGAAAVDFQVGTGRMPMVQPGTQALRKKPIYTDEQIEQLSAFVASLGPGPAVPTTEQYSLPANLTDDERAKAISEGGEFFRTNCTACHNFAGTGGALPNGRFAPTLKGVSKRHLYEAMLTGPQQMPVFTDEVMSSEDKAKVIAYIKHTTNTSAKNGTPNYGGFNLGGLGPVSEGLFAWLSLGILVTFAIWIAAHTARIKKDKQS